MNSVCPSVSLSVTATSYSIAAVESAVIHKPSSTCSLQSVIHDLILSPISQHSELISLMQPSVTWTASKTIGWSCWLWPRSVFHELWCSSNMVCIDKQVAMNDGWNEWDYGWITHCVERPWCNCMMQATNSNRSHRVVTVWLWTCHAVELLSL